MGSVLSGRTSSICGMTQPTNGGRTVPVGGRDIHIKNLTDLQMLHLLRHAKILEKDGIDMEQKLDSAERMFGILATIVVDPEDRSYLTKLEEDGTIELKDLLVFINGQEDDSEPEKPKVRRGRPPKRVAA
jgi:hypothetical protein